MSAPLGMRRHCQWLARPLYRLPPLDLNAHWPPHSDFLLTENSELDPALVSVLPIKSNTAVVATIFHSHSADDQRAIRLHLVPGDETQSFVFDPSRG